AAEWDHVVHGQISGRERVLAVVTAAGGPLALPPLGAAKVFGFVFFPRDMRIIRRDKKIGIHAD
ncbi:MAG: hypothetical protein QGH25_16500, partial [Candidatus Latescibacteria bacterium]|nr:hypothetical protein [Candidatus Latescibacterota bacterium]